MPHGQVALIVNSMDRYDHIGNPLTKTRDGSTDTYQYLVNASTGNTPILDQVLLGVGGTRDYTWGAAGHLEEVAAGANVLDFGADAEGRLSGVMRSAASETAPFTYDGRSFLRSAKETAGGTSSVDPLYDSAGVVHALRRQPSPIDPVELVVFFYLAGRPVAQVVIDAAAVETWSYVNTDHLGTPLLATDDAGALTWEGGFEPFGRDYQEGTAGGALGNGIYLRLPGQWEETSWQGATSGADVYYNVHRWYSPATGRYTRPEPEWYGDYFNTNPYFYALANPLRHWDPDGRRYWPPPAGGSLENYSSCPVLVFGDPGPLTRSEPIIVPAGGRRFFGLLPDPGRSPYFGDVDFICSGGQWIMIRGPVWIREDGQLRTILPARPATPGDEQGLPPCEDPPCQCTPPGGPNGR